MVLTDFNNYLCILRGDILRLECHKRRIGCPCKLTRRDGIYRQTGVHNHDSEQVELRRARAIRECEVIAGDPQFRRMGPKQVVEEARRRHPDAIISLNPAVEKRIQRAKRARQPLPPNTIEEMVESMRNRPEYR